MAPDTKYFQIFNVFPEITKFPINLKKQIVLSSASTKVLVENFCNFIVHKQLKSIFFITPRKLTWSKHHCQYTHVLTVFPKFTLRNFIELPLLRAIFILKLPGWYREVNQGINRAIKSSKRQCACVF